MQATMLLKFLVTRTKVTKGQDLVYHIVMLAADLRMFHKEPSPHSPCRCVHGQLATVRPPLARAAAAAGRLQHKPAETPGQAYYHTGQAGLTTTRASGPGQPRSLQTGSQPSGEREQAVRTPEDWFTNQHSTL